MISAPHFVTFDTPGALVHAADEKFSPICGSFHTLGNFEPHLEYQKIFVGEVNCPTCIEILKQNERQT